MATRTDREVGTVQDRLEQMTEELRKLEEARDLLREVEGRLRRGGGPEVEDRLTRLERLAGSWPEGHMARLLVESAVGSARAYRAGKAYSDVSRSRSAIEGEISTLRGEVNRESSERRNPYRRTPITTTGLRFQIRAAVDGGVKVRIAT